MRHHIPNLITGFRFLMVPPLVVLLAREHYLYALALFFLAGLSDAVDGFLAKHYGWQSRLGSVMDPLADKALLIATYVTLAWQGLLPVWLVGLIILRDAIIVGWAAAYQVLTGRLEMSPTWLSKLNTLAQIVLALAVIFLKGIDRWLEPLVQGLVAVVVLTTLASGFGYLLVWAKKTADILRSNSD